MSHKKATMLLAGLAMGLGGTAIAQTSSLDEARSFAAETRSDASRATLNQGAAGGPEIFGRLQFQYNVTLLDDPGAGAEDYANGFQNRRARLGAKGKAGQFDYYVQGNFGSNGGEFTLLDYYISTDVPGMEGEAKLKFGQFKSPFLYEELVSSANQPLVDRSFTNSRFSQGRSQGISFIYAGNEADDYKVEINFSDGFQSANTGFASETEADFAIGGRFDYKVQGAWSDFKDFSAGAGQEMALRFGGAIFYQQGDGTYALGSGATNELDLLSLTVDGQWEQDRISVFGAFILQDYDNGVDDGTDMGFVAQAGYRLDDQNEIYGRFDYILADADGVDDFVALTLGYTRFIDGHDAKFVADVFFVFETINNTPLAGGNEGLALLPDNGDPQAGLRAMFQLSF